MLNVSGPGAAVLATADPLGLEVAAERRLAWDDDVQAAVNSATSNIALNVAYFMAIRL